MIVPARVRWAVDVLDPGPDEHLLEAGCGPGVAAALVCARLHTGRLLAVDRSATAVARTTRRNAEHLAAGRLAVAECALDELTVPPGSLDQAFTINVNLFWVRDPGRELSVLRTALRPGGRLHVLYGADGPTGAATVTPAVAAALATHGFVGVEELTGPGGIGVSTRTPGSRS
ncbi:class I SAM-dependent methyltransferase [Pseudonocardia nigra]|uniref:class I SAM-dependent methyltransferase n=1 Tax=Pseudonocardia nigra TaxID=1921578 RepID=UPI001C5FF24D|nr:class I SAM-dependent methyltransferase [Pseudonocardia nigra]